MFSKGQPMPFEALRERLLRAGIAPRHVRRYLAELSDHLDDLIQAQRDAGYDTEDAEIRARARLGDDDDLAQAMLARPALYSLPARAPWLVFGLFPLAALIGLCAVPVVLLALIAGGHAQSGGSARVWFQDLTLSLVFLGNWALPPLTATLFAVLASRQRLPARWPLIAGIVLAVIGFHMQASFPGPHSHGGSLGIGLSFPGGQTGWLQWLMVTALTIMPALLYRAWRERSAFSTR